MDMRSILSAGTLAVFVGGCAMGGQSLPPMTTGSLSSASAAIPVSDGWQPGEVQITKPPSFPSMHDGVTERSGTTPEGLPYRYYSDSSGSVGKRVQREVFEVADWSISCRADAMTDEVRCGITHEPTKLRIGFKGRRPATACALKHDFPGRVGAIRIDKRRPIATNENGCVAWSDLAGALRGSELTVRYVNFPYDYPVDKTGSLTGLASAIALTAYLFDNYGKFDFQSIAAPYAQH